MSIFCGFPVIVMALPVLEERISAIRYGKGFIFESRQIDIITGV